MANDTAISHAEALRLIDAQIGAGVYIGRLAPIADPKDPESPPPFVHRLAPLKNPLAPKPPRLEPEVGFYDHGRESFCLPPMAGTIQLRDNGIDFRSAETLTVRVAWRGSEEVGERGPGQELPTRLGATSVRCEAKLDWELEQFFAGGRQARARIVEAVPAESGEGRRQRAPAAPSRGGRPPLAGRSYTCCLDL